MPSVQRGFRVLDAQVELIGEAESLAPICAAYARFIAPVDTLTDPVRIVLDEARRAVSVGDREFELVGEYSPTLQVYQHFLETLMDRVSSCAVLHAAALQDRSGRGLLIAAPSGHGKSSLTLALVERGFRFLSDDFAPIDLARGFVHPYPRAVAMLPEGGRAPVPEVFLRAAREKETQLFGKVLIDIGDVLGEPAVCKEPIPLATVVLLAGSDDPVAPVVTTLEVAASMDKVDRLQAAFDRIDGVTVGASRLLDGVHSWTLEIDHSRHPTRALSQVLDEEHLVLFDKRWSDPPDFDRSPEAVQIRRRHAAEFLGRELLNRRGGGQLLGRFGGRVPELFLELAGALRQASCWRVRTGRFRETVDLIEQLTSTPT